MLAKPQQSNLKDAHFKVTGKITDNGVTVELLGDGALVYKPKPQGRFKFQTTVGGETITIEGWMARDGSHYMRMMKASRGDGSVIGIPIEADRYRNVSDQK